MKYGLLTYPDANPRVNLGDYIQSLAARQFLPQVDAYLNREALASYVGDPIKLIMNGWFTHNVLNWIPSDRIQPLFISFHVNSSAAPYLLDEKGVAYLKKHEPIGCRDGYTVSLLESKGIRAYFSGCLTLTLDAYQVSESHERDSVYIVDPFCNYPDMERLLAGWKILARGIMNGDVVNLRKRSHHLKKIFAPELLRIAKFENQVRYVRLKSEDEKFSLADALLRKYAKARFVVTSRIHCALPCLAMGTPVIFINGFDSDLDTCRFDGIMNLFNRVDVDREGGYAANFDLAGRIDINTKVVNGVEHEALREKLREKCRLFVAQPDFE